MSPDVHKWSSRADNSNIFQSRIYCSNFRFFQRRRSTSRLRTKHAQGEWYHHEKAPAWPNFDFFEICPYRLLVALVVHDLPAVARIFTGGHGENAENFLYLWNFFGFPKIPQKASTSNEKCSVWILFCLRKNVLFIEQST